VSSTGAPWWVTRLYMGDPIGTARLGPVAEPFDALLSDGLAEDLDHLRQAECVAPCRERLSGIRRRAYHVFSLVRRLAGYAGQSIKEQFYVRGREPAPA
jgi:hypothetical protein